MIRILKVKDTFKSYVWEFESWFGVFRPQGVTLVLKKSFQIANIEPKRNFLSSLETHYAK